MPFPGLKWPQRLFPTFLSAGLLLALPPSAQAATFIVTKTADTADGACDADCSLREAIIAANALPGADTITLPAGIYTLTIAGASEDAAATGDLDILAGGLTINGAGAATTIIDGGALDRVFQIVAGTVSISGVTIRNGNQGGIGGGGGIRNGGTLTLINSTVSGNTAPGGGGVGGGINNQGTLTLTNSTVSGNTAGNFGGGIIGGTLIITNSTVSGNSSGGNGGGIDNSGTLTLTSSTVSGNTASSTGGGGIDNGGTATLTNVTVSGNSASGINGFGGGIRNNGTLTLTNSTVSGNTAIPAGGGGIFNISLSTLTLKNTIVANSSAGGDCGGPGTITSAGYNLSSTGTCGLTGTGDLPNTNPLLGPLAANGGPTQTHALLPGSPAIDAGSLDCPPPATDQRGVVRPQGLRCDIGAFEFQQPPTPTPTSTPVVTSTPTPPGATPTPTITQTPGGPTATATPTATQTPTSSPTPPGALTITTTSPLPSGVLGTFYSQTLAASGGAPPYTWSIVGSLPGGLSINSTTGVISGTPTTTGTFSFTAQVNDEAGATASRAFVITIAAVAPAAIPTLNSWGLLALTLLFAGLGAFALRRMSP